MAQPVQEQSKPGQSPRHNHDLPDVQEREDLSKLPINISQKEASARTSISADLRYVQPQTTHTLENVVMDESIEEDGGSPQPCELLSAKASPAS